MDILKNWIIPSCKSGELHEGEKVNLLCQDEECENVSCIGCMICMEKFHKNHKIQHIKSFFSDFLENFNEQNAEKIKKDDFLQFLDKAKENSLLDFKILQDNCINQLDKIHKIILDFHENIRELFLSHFITLSDLNKIIDDISSHKNYNDLDLNNK